MSPAGVSFLVLNAGSSSVKFGLYDAATLALQCRGGVDGMGRGAQFKVKGALAETLGDALPLPGDETHAAVVPWLIDALRSGLPGLAITAVGHRVVHGGAGYHAPMVVDDRIVADLARLVPLAPNHQPHNLAAIHAVEAAWPGMPQVACFDTAFHRGQPRLAQLYALPRALTDEGILRYGFHGLSYDYVAGVLPEAAPERAEGRVIVAHLGHGASMCALRGRRSIATTMGFTATDGLVMGRRSGALDPGVVLHLMREKGMSVAEVDDLLNKKSGLLGVSGVSDDVRDLEASGTAEAAEALDLFAYRAAREAGSLVAALGGLDMLVFTAGIGEHSAVMRARICGLLSGWAGFELDGAANDGHHPCISKPGSRTEVRIVPTDEEIVIARAMRDLSAMRALPDGKALNSRIGADGSPR